MRICGCNPRQCRMALASPAALNTATQKIINVIAATSQDLASGIYNMAIGDLIYAFEVCPSPDIRTWECFVTRPISDWAFSQLVAALDRQKTDAAYYVYRRLGGSRHDALGRQLFKFKVDKFFQSITEPRSFSIRSLDDPTMMFDIELSSAVVCHTFGSEEVFAGHLATSVRNQESCHLKPLSPIFPTFNSFLYQHTMSQSGYHPFMGIQVTDAASHSVSVQGLIGAQKSLKRRIPELNDLRPTTAKKWIILFVVPDSMATSFEKQIIKDADKVGDWDSKIAQYVLGLPEQEVLRS